MRFPGKIMCRYMGGGVAAIGCSTYMLGRHWSPFLADFSFAVPYNYVKTCFSDFLSISMQNNAPESPCPKEKAL